MPPPRRTDWEWGSSGSSPVSRSLPDTSFTCTGVLPEKWTERPGIIQSEPVSVSPSMAGPRSSGGGKALAGFLVSGFLMALLGAILPAWGYYRDPPAFTAV